MRGGGRRPGAALNYDPERAGALCAQCPLRGKPYVPPEGSSTADFVLVGEGPGFNEEKQRKPFVGASGVKLNEILAEVGVRRSQVFITNAILCRPEIPGLDSARKYEVKAYLAWLRKFNVNQRRHALAQAHEEIKQIRAYIRRQEKLIAAGEPHDAHWYAAAQKRLLEIEPKPLPSPFDCCYPRLRRELEHFEKVAVERHRAYGDRPNGAIVIPLGNYAAKAIVGKAGIMKLRGSPIPVDLNKENPQ